MDIHCKISAIITDIDGTLLEPGKKISRANIEALERYRRRGGSVFVATARPHHQVPRPEETDMDAGWVRRRGVFCSGATVIDEVTVLRQLQTLPKSTVDEILHITDAAGKHTQVVLKQRDGRYAFRLPIDDDIREGWGISREESIAVGDALVDACQRVLIFDIRSGHGAGGLPERIEAAVGGEVRMRRGAGGWVELLPAGATKETGIKLLLTRAGIPPEQVMALGDGPEDLSMLASCGVAVAMANAPAVLKNQADHVAPPCDRDGLARIVRAIRPET